MNRTAENMAIFRRKILLKKLEKDHLSVILNGR